MSPQAETLEQAYTPDALPPISSEWRWRIGPCGGGLSNDLPAMPRRTEGWVEPHPSKPISC